MSTLLVKNAHLLATMDDARREIAGGGLFVRDNVIEQVGPTAELPHDPTQQPIEAQPTVHRLRPGPDLDGVSQRDQPRLRRSKSAVSMFSPSSR